MEVLKYVSLFVFALSLVKDSQQTDTITVTCTPTTMTITETYANFGTSGSHLFYVSGKSSCPSSTLTDAASDNTITVSLSDDCVQGSLKEGYVGVNVVMAYSSTQRVITPNDKVGYAQCKVSEINTEKIVGSITMVVSSVSSTGTIDYAGGTSSVLYKKVSSSWSAVGSNAVDFADTDEVCVVVRIDSGTATDVHIKTLKFMSATSGGTEETYIDNYCADTTSFINSLFKSVTTDLNTDCTTLDTSNPNKNCQKQRAVCFTPFKFNVADTMHVSVTISIQSDTDTSYALKTCSGAATGVGRKKRDSENEDEEERMSTLIFPYIFDAPNKEVAKKCLSEIYLYIIYGLSFGILIDLTIITFGIFVICKRRQRRISE